MKQKLHSNHKTECRIFNLLSYSHLDGLGLSATKYV